MKPTFNEKLIAYLALLSGLSISAVAVYYSVVGLTAIFAAAAVPIIIMGTVLEISKLVATVWLKQNWTTAPKSIRTYLVIAVGILMFITSMGIFGFLSKAHSDQGLVSGEVLAKIAIYDEKLKTAKENIEADRRQLKQMDEAVDQVMARSTTEQGVDKSVAIRKAQARDRIALAKSIEANQKLIASLNNEAAPVRAEVRKVESEVGPIKYIATFIYGNTDPTILEKAVTWVIIILIVVFDPLAVILLLASQISFQNFRDRVNTQQIPEIIKESMEGNSPEKESDVVSTATVTEPFPTVVVDEQTKDEFNINEHPYLFNVPENRHPPGIEPVGPQVYKQETPTIESLPETLAEVITPVIQREETKRVRYKVFKRQEEIQEQPQQEERNEVLLQPVKAIAPEDYKNISQEKLDEKINEYVRLIREKKMDMSQVPTEILLQVRAKV